ncbi:putative MFS siderophore transporter [Trichodelitschia bisporula]|uniref:Putative MFS siderophore transporter n=1 Tax=Trichodelitschia bisporula TaxID=703511 RepID=A0A6G1I9U3_9PEZI|nr:putative MFS siderophore transporter [Trichodelitschia bisporula]
MSFRRFIGLKGKSPAGEVQDATVPGEEIDEKRSVTEAVAASNTSADEKPDEEAQHGVKKAEALTLAWTKPWLISLFVAIWFIYFINAFQQSITLNLIGFAISDFEAHSLIPVVFILSNVMAGALRLAVAKMLDLWGRPQGFVVMTSLTVMGIVLMAACKNVETFAAAQVFYWVGMDGMIYSCDVVTADVSSLRNRGLAFAFTASPYIITAFAGPKVAESYYEKISWRWAYGTFSIILPLVAVPLFTILWWNTRKAKKNGLLGRTPSGRTTLQSIWHYLIEFDALGVFFFAAGFVLFLLPFSIAESAASKWRSAHIIAMLVIGFVCLILFALIERFISPHPFVRFELLASRTIMGTCLLCASFQVGYYCWNSYYASYLQVVHGLTLAQAGYVSGVFDVISGVWCFVVGYLIRRTNHFKWLLMLAVPLDILGIGLMIHFRQPGTNIGYVIMCQIFIAFSGGTIILTQQVSIMSVAKHADLAAVLALLGLFGYIGGAIGNTISGAVWTHTMPDALAKYLPAEALANLTEIYDSLDVQLSYEEGDPVRDAIIKAYGLAQRNMCIAGTAVMALSLIWVLMIKNVNVKDVKQVKGLVF